MKIPKLLASLSFVLASTGFGAVTAFSYSSVVNATAGDASPGDSSSVLNDSVSLSIRAPTYHFGEHSMWAESSASGNFFQNIPSLTIASFEVEHSVSAFNTLGLGAPIPLNGISSSAFSGVTLNFDISERSLISISGGGVPADGYGMGLSSGSTNIYLYQPGLHGAFNGASIEVPAGSYTFTSQVSVGINPGAGDGFRTATPSFSLSIDPVSIPEPSGILYFVLSGAAAFIRRRPFTQY